MRAIVTSPMLTGMGDMFLSLYWTWNRQQELKSLGYQVTCIISCTTSFYTRINSNKDCEYLSRIFNMDILDDWRFESKFDINVGNFQESENFKLVNNYLNVIRTYVEKNSSINSLELIDFGDMFKRDDLQKNNLFTEETQQYLDNELSKFPKEFNLIHLRCNDFGTFIEDVIRDSDKLDRYVRKNKDKNIIFITCHNIVKDWVKEKKYPNVYFNDFEQTDSWMQNYQDEELYNYLKKTLVDMYLVSYAKEVLRLGVLRYSAFLHFGVINNHSSVPNETRFVNFI